MPYKIAYLTSKNPLDKRESSGVYYYQASAFKDQNIEIHFLGPVNNLLIYLLNKASIILQKLIKKRYNTGHSIITARVYGKIFSRKLKKGNYDFVFADKASCEIAYLKTDIPVIYSTDATFKGILNYYPHMSNLLRVSEKEGNIVEQKAIDNASIVICASQWAANSVIGDYGFPHENVHVIPRGANIDRVPERNLVSEKKLTDVCRLLYMGKECYRKGYDIAYKTMVYIREKGIAVKLFAVGCSPPQQFIDEDVEVINYINKNTAEGLEQFDRLMVNSDFFLLPTRAECMGIAFSESSAYGLPVITRDTGGVTEVVKDSVNGYALPFDSDHKDFGEKIISIFNSKNEYTRLIETSREYFEKRLNWQVWGEQLKIILDNHIVTSRNKKIAVTEPGEKIAVTEPGEKSFHRKHKLTLKEI